MSNIAGNKNRGYIGAWQMLELNRSTIFVPAREHPAVSFCILMQKMEVKPIPWSNVIKNWTAKYIHHPRSIPSTGNFALLTASIMWFDFWWFANLNYSYRSPDLIGTIKEKKSRPPRAGANTNYTNSHGLLNRNDAKDSLSTQGLFYYSKKFYLIFANVAPS